MFDLSEVQERLKQQDEQIRQFNKAQELVKNGEIQNGITILENIMYKEGLVVRGVNWPFILAKVYYSNKMYNKCWVYLNFLQANQIGEESKVLEFQSKVRNAEKKYKDTLFLKILAIYKKYSVYVDIPSRDIIENEIHSIVNKFNGKVSEEKYIQFLIDALTAKIIDIDWLKQEILKEDTE